ncbi:hypothetical protein GMA12_17940 [Kocuria sediminis]|uniref:Lysyl oxidase n=1 Tax=Kocuria sediminis TaxID=1038857 RepID=A0A6N8GPG3_9MICC|nr:lysyl oxidase family protein [Kocuria sediminis]MUN64996.1 hypothetical protein [Kocuria sediminis]
MNSTRKIIGGFLGQFALVASLVLAPISPAAAATDKLPDLRMAHPTNIYLEKTSSGRRLLRFDSIVVNVGTGAFEAAGSAKVADEMTTIQQRIYNTEGGFRDQSISGTRMYWGRDGHNHWHLRDLETYSLNRLDNGAQVGTGAKHGFCFFDNVAHRTDLPNAPRTAQYQGCGNFGDSSVVMGLSVGWGDLYGASLPDQFIDITNLKAGRYRLHATADEQKWFVEQNNTNNHTWVDLQIKGNSVTVTQKGPGA